MTGTRIGRPWLALALTALTLAAGATWASGYIGGKTVEVRVEQVHGKSRHLLTTHDGLTLYYSPKDSATSTHCGSSCGDGWHPYALVGQGRPTASEEIRVHLSTLQLSSHVFQVEYNGHPLYTYAQDSEPGDVEGAGQGPYRVATVALGPNPKSVKNSGPASPGGG